MNKENEHFARCDRIEQNLYEILLEKPEGGRHLCR